MEWRYGLAHTPATMALSAQASRWCHPSRNRTRAPQITRKIANVKVTYIESPAADAKHSPAHSAAPIGLLRDSLDSNKKPVRQAMHAATLWATHSTAS